MYLISSGNFGKKIGSEKTALRAPAATALICVGLLSATSSASLADESGTSFWLPGQFGSLAAAPETPGWAIASVYYHTSVSADVAAAREIQIGRFKPQRLYLLFLATLARLEIGCARSGRSSLPRYC
jgi:hypothetical protein